MSHELSLWVKKICILIGFIVLAYVLYVTRGIVSIILISSFITMLVTPLVDALEKKRIHAGITLVWVYIAIILIATVIIGTIIPIIVSYITDTVSGIITWSRNAQILYNTEGIGAFNLHPYVEHLASQLVNEENMNKALRMIENNVGTIQSMVTNQVSNVTSGWLSIITNVGWVFLNWILIGVMVFLMTLERVRIWKFILEALPNKLEKYLDTHYKEIQNTLNAWIKAMLILWFSMFFVTYIGLTIVWFFFWDTGRTFTLALIAGVMEFIPYMGPIIAMLPALIIALGISWQYAIAIIALYYIIQMVENNFLVPYIMSKSLDLSPLLVFIVMLIGAVLGGITGIIVAVPVTAILRILYVNYQSSRSKKSKK